MGFAPHWQSQILYAAHLADFQFGDAFLSDVEHDRLRAQAAFLAYTVSRPDYWSPARGFSANPGMTSTVAAYKAYLACLIHDHPLTTIGWMLRWQSCSTTSCSPGPTRTAGGSRPRTTP